MSEEPFYNEYEDRRPNFPVVILILLIIGSPGFMILFATFPDSAILFLALAIPLILAFVYWYIRILRTRSPV